jgi:hypothetical protein
LDALIGAEDGPAHHQTSSMYHFHVNIFAEPNAASFACTWEDAATALEALPRMMFELDGSFVISGNESRAPRAGSSPTPSETSTRWQVDGHLFDFAGKLHRVELHGHCPQESFDALLRTLGWPQQQLGFELVREGLTVDEQTFRALVATH